MQTDLQKSDPLSFENSKSVKNNPSLFSEKDSLRNEDERLSFENSKPVSTAQMGFDNYNNEDQFRIDKVNTEIEENIPEAPKELLNNADRIERVSLNNMTINRLKREQEKVVKQPEEQLPWYAPTQDQAVLSHANLIDKKENIDRLTQEIVKLQMENKKLSNAIRPITKLDKQDAMENIYKPIDYENKIGDTELATRIRTEATKDNIEIKKSLEFNTRQHGLDKTPNVDQIFSLHSIKNTPRTELKYIQPEEYQVFLKELKSESKWISGNFEEKKKLAQKFVKNLVRLKGDLIANPELAEANILDHVARDITVDENGQPTIEWAKAWAKDAINNVDIYGNALRNDYNRIQEKGGKDVNPNAPYLINPKKENPGKDKFLAENGQENYDSFTAFTQKEIVNLERLKQQLNRLEIIQENNDGIRDVGQAIKSARASDFDMGLSDMMEALQMNEIIGKVQEGKSLTYSEDLIMQTYAATAFAQGFKTEGMWYNGARGAAIMAPYIGQLLITNPGFAAVKLATTKAINPLLRSALKVGAEKSFRQGVADVSSTLIGYTMGTAARLPGAPTMIIKNTADNMKGAITSSFTKEGITYDSEILSGDPIAKGALKGVASTFNEFFWEGSGETLVSIPKAVINKGSKLIFKKSVSQISRAATNKVLSKITGKAYDKTQVLASYIGTKGVKSIEGFTNFLTKNKLQWNGPLAENLEELATYFVENKIQGKTAIQPGFKENLITTAITIGMFGLPMKTLNFSQRLLIGDDVKFTVAGRPGQQERKIVIPKKLYDSFTQMLDPQSGAIATPKQVNDFLLQHENSLSKDQFQLLFSLAQNSIINKTVDLANKSKTGKVLTTDEAYEARKKNIEKQRNSSLHDISTEGQPGATTKAKQQQIIKENKRYDKMLEDAKDDYDNAKAQDRINEEAAKFNDEGLPANFNDEIIAEEEKPAPPVLTTEEQKVVEQTNNRVREEWTEFYDADLLDTSDSGQLVEPNKESTQIKLKRVNDLLAYASNYDAQGQLIHTDEVDQLLKQQDVLTQYNEYFSTAKGAFENMTVEEQHGKIVEQLRNNKISGLGRVGTLNTADAKFAVTLDDVTEDKKRIVYAYLDPNLSQKDKEKAINDIKNKAQIKLKVEDLDDWNPNGDIKKSDGTPIYNRIRVMNGNRTIGFVEYSNPKIDADIKERKEEREREKGSEFAERLRNMRVQKPIDEIMEDDFAPDRNKQNTALINKQIEINGRRQEELKKEFGKDLDLIESERIAVIERQPISSFSQEKARELVKKLHEINNRYDAELEQARKDLGAKETPAGKGMKIEDWMNENSEISEETKKVIETLQKKFSEISDNVTITDDQDTWDELLGADSTYGAFYLVNSETGAVTILLNKRKNPGAESLAHEMIHAFTQVIIDNPQTDAETKFVEELTNLFDQFKQIENTEQNWTYQYNDIHEFVSYALTNKSFQDFLKNNVVEEKSLYQKFIDFIKELFGIDTGYLNKVIDLVTSTIKETDYVNYNDRVLISAQLFETDKGQKAEEPEPDINDETKKQAIQNLLDSINAVDFSDLDVTRLIPTIIKYIDKAGYSEHNAGYLKAYVYDNQQRIINNAARQSMKAEGKPETVLPLTLDETILPEINTLTTTGDQRVQALRDSYSTLWKNIADKLGTTREEVERTMYNISHIKGVAGFLQNEGIFRHWLTTLDLSDRITSEIVDLLKVGSLTSAVSLFDTYSSFHTTKQFGFYYTKKAFSFRILNPSESYDDFKNRFWSRIANYKDSRGYTSYEAIKKRISAHVQERDDRFKPNKSWKSDYEMKPKEEKERLRREQHESDLELLSDITGISVDLWRQYFNEQTRETYAFASTDAKNEINYNTYDNLLANDTWRIVNSQKGREVYNRVQSNLVFQLGLTLTSKSGNNKSGTDINSFTTNLNNFFLKGDASKGTLSNLYKLSTAIKSVNDIGQSGFDIKGDRFNSYKQSSHLTTIADNIRNSTVSNHVVEFYKQQEKDMEFLMLNGLHNIDDNSDQDGTESVNMSNEDLWIAQLVAFVQSEDTYWHWIGQNGDKPSIEMVEVPKFKDITQQQIDDLKKIFPDFDQAVKDFTLQYINFSLINDLIHQGVKAPDRKARREQIAQDFIYNFARNMQATNELFRGNDSSYKDKNGNLSLVDLVKRGGSLNSPGIPINQFIEGGVGMTYRFGLVSDEWVKKFEEFDGLEVMSGDYAKRFQVSMGSTLSKIAQFPILNSVKCLTSFIDPATQAISLTKTNRKNIDYLANSGGPNSKYWHLREFMKANSIDVLSFPSGVKKHESGKKPSDIAIKLWDAEGKLISNPKIIEGEGIVTRNNSDVYIQQDLRHSNKPSLAKMSSQMIGNILILHQGPDISQLINKLRIKLRKEMENEFSNLSLKENKIAWLKEKVSEKSNPELYRLLQLGLDPSEPATANYLRNIISNHLTDKVLEISVNRVTSEEIPDVDGILQRRRPYIEKITDKDGNVTEIKHIALPEINANIAGARYENRLFEGRIEEAIKYVEANRAEYRDLFELNDKLGDQVIPGELMRWIIEELNGVIPGEIVISTRTPADDLHSHTVGRLKNQMTDGNDIMLDRESRRNSGSDFDGDQRFTQVFFKNEQGKIFMGESKEGVSNEIMMQVAMDYMNPEFDDKIRNPIDVKAYDEIVDLYREKKKFNFLDWRGYEKARNENMVGVKMKGKLTNAITIYSIISRYNVPFRNAISIPVGLEEVALSKMDQKNVSELLGTSVEIVSKPWELHSKGIGISVLRNSKTPFTHYGNPWGTADKTTLSIIKTNSVAEAVQNYRDWLNGTKWQEVEPKRREWILNQINSGKLKGKTLLYYKDLGEDSHADVLAEIANDKQETKKTSIVNKYINLTGFVRDPKGLMKNHLANFLNLAFDNAQDPKLEDLGINEVTVDMFVIAFLGKRFNADGTKFDTTNEAEIYKHIEDLVKYFTSPPMKRFTELMRRDNGGLRKADFKNVQSILAVQHGQNVAKEISWFYTQSKDLSKLRKYYKLTQEASTSTSEMASNINLHRDLKLNNEETFRLFNLKNLYNENGIITEFKTIEPTLQFSHDYIYSDTFFYSKAGEEIRRKIGSQVFTDKDKKRKLSDNENSSIDYSLNTISALRALGLTQTARQIERELLDNFDNYKKQYPNNIFFNYVVPVLIDGKFHLEIDSDYKNAKINDKSLERIKKDFDALYEVNPDLATKLVANTIYRKGTSTVTSNGGYYSLVGDKFRVDFSKKVREELNKWNNDGLSSLEKYQITAWTIRKSKEEALKAMALNRDKSLYYDINSIADIDSPLSKETLEGISQISTMEGFRDFLSKNDTDETQFRRDIKRIVGVDTDKIKFKGDVPELIKKYEEIANKAFPANTKSGIEPKHMLAPDAVGEALVSEDPELQEFVYQRLRKMYPEIIFFTNQEEFFAFVEKWGGKGRDVSQHALGSAFMNAIFIDTDQAVQSTLFHESGHIYWDALPVDHPVKKRLIRLFQEQYPNMELEDIEEQIMLEIGRAGVDMANIKLRGSAYAKFVQYLKQFWNTVKQMFGKYSDTDLVKQIAWDIWYNQDSINPSTGEGSVIIKNMIEYDHSMDDSIFFDDSEGRHDFRLGGIHGVKVKSTTGVIGMFKELQFNLDTVVENEVIKKQATYFTAYKETMPIETADDIRENTLKHWSKTVAESGTEIHAVGEAVFGNTDIPDVENFINSNFANHDVYVKIKKGFEEIKNYLKEMYDLDDSQFYVEKKLMSRKFGAAGIADLIIEMNDGTIKIFDWKTTDHEFAADDGVPFLDYKKSFGMFKSPFQNLPNSKYVTHMLQLNIYANMIEEPVNADGKHNQVGSGTDSGLRIVPIIRSYNEDNKVDKVQFGNWVRMERTDATKKIAEDMLRKNHLSQLDNRKRFAQYDKNMRKDKVHVSIRSKMLKAMAFFSEYTDDIKNIKKNEIGSMRNAGIRAKYSRLLSNGPGGLGFKVSDIRGDTALSTEELINIEARNITRLAYIGGIDDKKNKIKGQRDNLWVDQPIYVRLMPVKNEKKDKNKKYQRFEDQLVMDIGIDDIDISKEGKEKGRDKIFVVRQIKDKSGVSHYEGYDYKVIEIFNSKGEIKVVNELTGNTLLIGFTGANDGFLKKVDKLPKNVEDPGNGPYVPAYDYQEKTEVEKHWKDNQYPLDPNIPADQEAINQNRRLWNFYRNVPLWKDLEDYTDNLTNVNDFYTAIKEYDARVASGLQDLFIDEGVNHDMADNLVDEHRWYDDVPESVLPETIRIYQLIEKDDPTIWNEMSGWLGKFIRVLTPRMIDANVVPLKYITEGVQRNHIMYSSESFDMNKALEKFTNGELNIDDATVVFKGVRYWKYPDEKGIHAYKDDLTGEFLRILYRYYKKFDPKIKAAFETDYPVRIKVSEIYMNKIEFTKKYGRLAGSGMHAKLQPSSHDMIRLKVVTGFKHGQPTFSGEVKTLREIKEDFAKMNMSDTKTQDEYIGPKRQRFLPLKLQNKSILESNTSSILNYQMDKAKKIYETGGDNDNLNRSSAIHRNKRTMSKVGRGKTPYASVHLVEAEARAIDSMILAFYMEKMQAPIEWIKRGYKAIHADHAEEMGVYKYLQEWTDIQLYNLKPEQKNVRSKTFSQLIDLIHKRGSLAKIAFSLTTQVNNFTVGQGMDFIMNPDVAWKGITRLFDGGDPYNNIIKIKNILKKNNMGNVISDRIFELMEKEDKVFGVMNMSKFESWGYAPMEFVEQLNQFHIFIGLMTKEEWDAYDKDGTLKIKDSTTGLSAARTLELSRAAKNIHGDYGKINTAPGWSTDGGKLVLFLKKWLPSMIYAQTANYHLNDEYKPSSGIFMTIGAMSLVLRNNLNVSRQIEHLERLRERDKNIEDGTYDENIYFSAAAEYVETLGEEINEGRILWSDLSENDKMNLRRLMRMVIAYAALTMYFAMTGDPDDENYHNPYTRALTKFFTRYSSDLFFLFTWDNYDRLMKSPSAGVGYVLDVAKFAREAYYAALSLVNDKYDKKAKYAQDSKYAERGTFKFIVTGAGLVRGGSAIKYLMSRYRIYDAKHTYVDMSRISQKIKDKLGITDKKYSVFEIEELSKKFMLVYRAEIKARKVKAFGEKGIDPRDILLYEEAAKDVNQEMKYFVQALSALNLEKLKEDPNFGEMTKEEILKNIKIYDDAEAGISTMKRSALKKEAIKSIGRIMETQGKSKEQKEKALRDFKNSYLLSRDKQDTFLLPSRDKQDTIKIK